jgi:hypothetical protein
LFQREELGKSLKDQKRKLAFLSQRGKDGEGRQGTVPIFVARSTEEASVAKKKWKFKERTKGSTTERMRKKERSKI